MGAKNTNNNPKEETKGARPGGISASRARNLSGSSSGSIGSDIRYPIQPILPMNPATTYPDQLNEDTDIELITNEGTSDSSYSIQSYMKSAFPYIQLNSSAPQDIPCMFGLSCSGSSSSKPGIDFMCVIDVSGSMRGTKIDLVKKTIQFIIHQFGDNDRIGIVLFNNHASILTSLTALRQENKSLLQELVDRIDAQGGTNIVGGLDLGLYILSKRQIQNTVTTILLLSDGMDNNRSTALERSIQSLSKYQVDCFIHCFGYGEGHDSELLSAIAEQKNGTFRFLPSHDRIAGSFARCLGELVSVVADSVEISLVTQPCSLPISLTTVYTENGDSTFTTPPLLAKAQRDSIFVLSLEQCSAELEEDFYVVPIIGKIRYREVKTREIKENVCELRLKVINEREEVKEIEVDQDVIFHFYREKGADILKEAKILGDRGSFEEAKTLLARGAEELRNCVVSERPAIKKITDNLISAIDKFRSQSEWEATGKAELRSRYVGHHRMAVSSEEEYYNDQIDEMKVEALNFF